MKTKQEEYTRKILEQLETLFTENSDNAISLTELEDNNNAADFFHALANLAPAVVYSQLTQKQVNTLEFNHVANRLCVINSVTK